LIDSSRIRRIDSSTARRSRRAICREPDARNSPKHFKSSAPTLHSLPSTLSFSFSLRFSEHRSA
jgi:hypothetical protein